MAWEDPVSLLDMFGCLDVDMASGTGPPMPTLILLPSEFGVVILVTMADPTEADLLLGRVAVLYLWIS